MIKVVTLKEKKYRFDLGKKKRKKGASKSTSKALKGMLDERPCLA